MSRAFTRAGVVLGSVFLLAAATRHAIAIDKPWINAAGGLWQTPTNWTGGLPVANDRALFDLQDAGYTVTFNSNVSDVGILVRNDNVTFDLDAPANGYTLSVSDASPLILGDNNAQNARLTVTRGIINTTSSGGSAIGVAEFATA